MTAGPAEGGVMVHLDGDPEYCASECPGPHFDDAAPAVCAGCGGNGRGCWPHCTGQTRRYEPWEGLTAAQQLTGDGGHG